MISWTVRLHQISIPANGRFRNREARHEPEYRYDKGYRLFWLTALLTNAINVGLGNPVDRIDLRYRRWTGNETHNEVTLAAAAAWLLRHAVS